MIYNEKDGRYKVKFYKNSQTGKEPVLDYIKNSNQKIRQKINKYLDFLLENQGYLDEPYARHIVGKIRELRVDFANQHHRIFYFAFVGKTIILLTAFLKNSRKTPPREIILAEERYNDSINHPELYE